MKRSDLAAVPLSVEQAYTIVRDLEGEMGTIIVGQQKLIRRLLTGLFASIPYSFTGGEPKSGCGHLLLEGVPGVAKTLLAAAAATLGVLIL